MRRAFLCGKDPVTGRSFDHRKQWVEDRIVTLAQSFAVAVHAYAVMSNHFHIVLEADPASAWKWSDEETARRCPEALRLSNLRRNPGWMHGIGMARALARTGSATGVHRYCYRISGSYDLSESLYVHSTIRTDTTRLPGIGTNLCGDNIMARRWVVRIYLALP